MDLVTASSFSSAQSLPKKHDVFMSFRGDDTRSNFTSHLYDAFCRKHVRTYIDYQLPKGDDISPSLLKAIEDSYISVVVFSENYASSRWCLDELTHILHCKRVQGQIAVPIFYKVEPSHVRNQTGVYRQAFERYERDLKVSQHKMQMWQQALHEAANLAGYDSQTFRDESGMIQKIVMDILQKLNYKYPPAELKGLVGIGANYAEIELLMRDAKTIGIWGMGGIGKSTIAKTIFSKYYSHYEGSCFLENVREQSGNGLVELRHKFLSCLLNENICINTSTTFLESRLSCMKVFVVLDDISTVKQLEYLVGEPHCFDRGSKILITTRDKHVLSKGVDEIYEVKELDLDHSYKLFHLNAFNTDRPIRGYEKLTKRAVVYAKGVPLALKVLGSYLYGRSEVEWESALRKLEKKSPHDDIQKVLRLSYDGLNHEEKKMFLDIACFLKGELTNFVINFLDSCGFHGAVGIRILHDKALINVDDDQHIKMHDLIEDMGLQIVREESIDEPERRSRLWDSGEIYDVLHNNVGSSKVEGLKLNVSKIRDIHLEADVFKKMPNLRYLMFLSNSEGTSSHVNLPKGLEFLPNKIRYLLWYEFPLKSLPSTFCAEKLVKLYMPHSQLQKLWNGVQDLVSLQEIDLSGSTKLQELPDLSKCLNLKIVNLYLCKNLGYVHSSILSLHSLVKLCLDGCEKLRSLKSEIHLKSLQEINLKFCWNLQEFALSSNELRWLDLESTGIEILHPSVGRSIKLNKLHLNGSRLVDLPDQLSCLKSLTILELSNCNCIDDLKLYVLFNGMLSLRIVKLDYCCNIIELPNNTKHLLGLKSLILGKCRSLFSLPELPPYISILVADNCELLEIVPTWILLSGGSKDLSFVNCMQLNEQSLHNIMEAVSCVNYYMPHENTNHVNNYSSIIAPGSKVPKHFKYRAAQHSVVVELPQISDLVDFFYCVVIGFNLEIDSAIILERECYLEGFKVDKSHQCVNVPKTKYDHVSIWNDDHSGEGIMCEIRRGNQHLFANRKLHFKFTVIDPVSSEVMIKECGVWPVYVSECKKMDMKEKRVADNCVKDLLPTTKKLKNSGVSQSTPLGLELGLANAKSKKSCDNFICHPLQLKFISKMKEKDPSQLSLNASTSKFMASKQKYNAKWDRCTTKILLEICIKEIHTSGKLGIAFRAKRWEVVVDEFNKLANKNYDQKQLKNRLDNLRSDWTSWKQLGKETGLGWNHETGTIVADDTWWEAKIKDNSKYARFRYQGLEFCEELEIIFGETVVTSQHAWTPTIGVSIEDGAINTTPTILEEIAEYGDEESNPDEDASPIVNNQLKRKKMTSEAMSKKMAKGGKQKSGIATSMLKTANVAESHNAAEAAEMSQTFEINEHFSIPNGIKILKKLRAEGKLDAKQFFYAVDLLRVQQERIIIMSFSESIDDLVGWILYKYELDKNSGD